MAVSRPCRCKQIEVWTYHAVVVSMQVPFTLGFQKWSTGVHANIAINEVMMEYTMITPIRTYAAILILV